MLDADYPREINVGFDNIPDHLDAAFALPAPGHNGREKVYFFKGTGRHMTQRLRVQGTKTTREFITAGEPP